MGRKSLPKAARSPRRGTPPAVPSSSAKKPVVPAGSRAGPGAGARPLGNMARPCNGIGRRKTRRGRCRHGARRLPRPPLLPAPARRNWRAIPNCSPPWQRRWGFSSMAFLSGSAPGTADDELGPDQEVEYSWGFGTGYVWAQKKRTVRTHRVFYAIDDTGGERPN